jgi:hypothetical protein
MIVTPLPQTSGTWRGSVRAACRIAYERGHAVEELWFEVPEAFAADLVPTGDPWLLALLPLAFQTGERLVIEAPCDAALLRHVEEIQRIWKFWYPPLMPVPVAATIAPPGPGAGERTGLFFTLGVDSFFTLLHHDDRQRTQPLPGERAVDDLLFVWGFDLPLANAAAFERKQAKLMEIARASGKQAVCLATNLRLTRLRELDWGQYTYGLALGAAGVLLGGRYARLLFSASDTSDYLEPWGEHPLIMPLIATGNTRLVHYGLGYDRFEKTEHVAASELALRHLHVCYRDASDRNCGRCEKCLRTQATLAVLGALDSAAGFAANSFSPAALARCRPASTAAVAVLRQLQRQAARRGRSDIAGAVAACLRRHRRFERIENTLRALAPLPWLGAQAVRTAKRIRRRTVY